MCSCQSYTQQKQKIFFLWILYVLFREIYARDWSEYLKRALKKAKWYANFEKFKVFR